MSLLRMRGVHRVFSRGPEVVHALSGVDLDVESGRITAVIGASGSGKTTLLNLAGGVDRPTEGEIHFRGDRVDTLSEARLTRLRRGHVGMIFQDFLLVPVLTALQNVSLPLMFSGGGRGGRGGRALELLEKANIRQRAGFYPGQLSGGEQQRVAIARALINDPELLLADEPTGNLDSVQAGSIFDLFRALADETGLAVLLATHDEDLARRADLSLRLRDGKLEPS